MNVASVTLQKDDTLDFVVDFNAELNSDQYLWAPVIREVVSAGGSASDSPQKWDAEKDFSAPVRKLLTPWQQLAQVLLISNEFMFVD